MSFLPPGGTSAEASPSGHGGDRERVADLLGRSPSCEFQVVVRAPDGDPVVIRNAPFFEDGTPMPTRYWLVGRDLVKAVSRLESNGGARRVEQEIGADEVTAAHELYAAERDASIPRAWAGPRPSGGVGGTRRGVKCLHAHLAWFLAGGPDPIGAWVHGQLAHGHDVALP